MRYESFWSISNVCFTRAVPLIIASATIVFSTPAFAVGTSAGTTISNTATATYNDPSGAPQTLPSNTVDIKVDELLDVTVVSADPGDVVVTPGSPNRVLSFTITNTGNGSEAFSLTPTNVIGGDQFDPAVTSIVIDTNGNGVYDAGVDTVYTLGTNDPVLAADTSITVFILSTIPAGVVDGNTGFADLTARAVTGAGVAGTGVPGTNIPGAGQGGGDAVIGATGADGTDRGTYLVQQATITFVKSAAVADVFGGTKPVPGSTITYTLVATISGTGTLTNAVIGDPIPVNSTYQAGTLTLQGGALSDPVDSDAGEVVSGNVAVRLGSVGAGQTRTVTFQVKIN